MRYKWCRTYASVANLGTVKSLCSQWYYIAAAILLALFASNSFAADECVFEYQPPVYRTGIGVLLTPKNPEISSYLVTTGHWVRHQTLVQKAVLILQEVGISEFTLSWAGEYNMNSDRTFFTDLNEFTGGFNTDGIQEIGGILMPVQSRIANVESFLNTFLPNTLRPETRFIRYTDGDDHLTEGGITPLMFRHDFGNRNAVAAMTVDNLVSRLNRIADSRVLINGPLDLVERVLNAKARISEFRERLAQIQAAGMIGGAKSARYLRTLRGQMTKFNKVADELVLALTPESTFSSVLPILQRFAGISAELRFQIYNLPSVLFDSDSAQITINGRLVPN